MSSKQIEFDESFLREARIGLMVVTVLMAVFIYVAYGRLSGWNASEGDANGYPPIISEKRQEATLPALASESQVALIPDHTEPTEMAQDVQLATAIEPATVDDAVSASTASTVPDLPVESGSPASEIDSPTRPTSPFKATLIPENDTADLEVDRSTNSGGDFDTSGATAMKSSAKFDAKKTQQEEQPPKRQSDNKENAGAKPPWNLKLPTLRPTKPIPQAAVKPSPVKQSVDVPEAKTASSSSFIPGTGFDKMPKAAPANSAGVPAIPASAKTLVKPKANAPSPALGEFPGASPLPFVPASTVVEKGEGFWLVAQRIYGDGRFFDALYQANRKRVKSFNEVSAGTEIITPSINELRQRWPHLCPRKVYKTKKGETLFEVASEQLGQASRYVEILKLNYTRLPRGVKQDTPLDADINLELPRKQ